MKSLKIPAIIPVSTATVFISNLYLQSVFRCRGIDLWYAPSFLM